MQFIPRDLARDYDWNGMVERRLASDVGVLAGEPPTDFFEGMRTSHDWSHGDIKIESKTTMGTTFFCELYKDRDRQIKSGIGATEADLVLILSMGRGPIPPGSTEGVNVGKLRLVKPRALRAACRGKPLISINKSATVTEQAYGVNLELPSVNHWWIGDVGTALSASGDWMFDLDNITWAPTARDTVRSLFQSIREDKMEILNDQA